MESLGPYTLGRRLGSGGMGVVYAAHDTALDRPVALKVISPHLADDPEFRARFTREARAQAALDSEHVVRVHAHGEHDGRLWIATQLVPDGDLGRLLREHGLPPRPVAVDLIDQVAAGLADAHAAGLVHRDIKPANVLLRRGPRLRAYLADFGIAGPEGAGFDDAGTPRYMAPELTAGGRASVASDVYALGRLLRAVLPAGDPLNPVVDRATARRPEDRYPSVAAFRSALAEPADRRPARRWAAAVPLTALGILLLGAVLAWVAWIARLEREAPDPPAPDPSDRAAVELAESLAGPMTAGQADCAAAYVLDDLGLDRLVAAGLFAEDGAFLDPDLAGEPEVRASLRAAALACVGG